MKSALFEKNLTLLKENHPALAAQVIKEESALYEVYPTKKGYYNLSYLGTNPPTLFYNPHNPEKGAKNYTSRIAGKSCRIPVILGFGLGYEALNLLQRKDLIKMIIVERDTSCFKKAMEVVDLSYLLSSSSVKIIVGSPEQDLYVLIYQALSPHFPGLKEIKFFPLPAALRIALSYYQKVMLTFKQITDTFVADRGNDPFDTLVAYEHFFANIEELLSHPGAAHVKNLFSGKPAFVIATGPSLKKNVHLLKGIENSAVLISADASLRILHSLNIFPHLVTTIERPPGFAAYYQGLDNLDKTVFAAVSFVHPSTLAAYRGPRIFFHRIYNFMWHLGFAEDAIKMGMSTANMAYEVARHMGCNPIILVGNDLAFDVTGNTHAEGFLLGEKQPLYAQMERLEVPGNYEPYVRTCEGWLACIREYEKRIANWEGTLINATAGGAKIQGSVVMDLKEAIDRYCCRPFYPREILLNHLKKWENHRDIGTLLKQVEHFMEVTDDFLRRTKEIRFHLDGVLCDLERGNYVLNDYLAAHIKEILPPVETLLNNLIATELFKFFEEYLYTEIFPLLMEWQVIDTRFTSPDWAAAYRIKLAENFFGALGQLLISLKTCLADGRNRLLALL